MRLCYLLPSLLRAWTLAYTPLSDSTLRLLPAPGDDFDIHTGDLLAPILVPRVPGTPGSTAVLNHFVDFFSTNLPKWKLSYQNSSQVTPTSDGKPVPFVNLIATRDPPWADGDGDVGRLALVAHYDSKLTPTGFIGATDSAAPCAMLLHTARSLDAALTAKWAAEEASGEYKSFGSLEAHRGIQILLLDGEEAFQQWTDTDSLYGARSLAEEWEKTSYGALSDYRSPLRTIDLFVLLDLLGSANPKVPSYFKTTHWAYQLMANLESRLRKTKVFKSNSKPFLFEGHKSDKDRWTGGYVEDDHVPFMARGVEILHIITSPFPAVWHKIEDDGEHLDMDTVADWAMLTLGFAAEWLELEGWFGDSSSKTGEETTRDEL